MGLALLLTCAAAVPLGYWAERYWKTHDPKYFVLDEAAGFFLTALLIREGDVYWTALCAFLATRFFDVVKPFPARRLERLPGGWGILLDDLAASLYAAASLHAAAWLFPQLPGPLRLLAPF
jgi:phosphatidylglycerophosphatase A